MSSNVNLRISSLFLAGMILVVSAYAVLIFYVPRLIAFWAESGDELGPAASLLVWISHSMSDAGFMVFPLLILDLGAALTWRIRCSWAIRSDNA